jgi:hypothetical protein
MVHCVECFLEVHKYSACKFAFIKCFSDGFCNVDEGVVGGMLWPESVLVLIEGVVVVEKCEGPGVY